MQQQQILQQNQLINQQADQPNQVLSDMPILSEDFLNKLNEE